LKRFFKRNTHNFLFRNLAGLGRSVNRLYENRNHDIYSNGELTIIRKISGFNPSVIIDGGANIGNYSILLAGLNQESTIYALEPVGKTFEQLKSNIQRYDNVVPVNKGLYSDTCQKEINLFNAHTHASLYEIKGVSYQAKDSQVIDLMTGDDFVEKNKIEEIGLLKLDLEGAEYDALVGFEKTLKRKKIKLIQFEYGYINISTRRLLADFYSLLGSHGYIIGKVFPKIVEFREYKFKHEDFIGPNFVAVRKEDKDLIDCLIRK